MRRTSGFEPRRPTCPSFYKYATAEHLEYLRDILLNHEVYFSSHPQLNDPLDGWAQFHHADVDEVIAFLANGFIERHPGAERRWLAREIKAIDFNARRFGALTLIQLMAEELKRQTERNRVYCLSMARAGEHMWQKYGGNHTGYCLEFVNDGLFRYALEVDYNDTLIGMDLRDPGGMFFFRKTLKWRPEQEARVVMFPRAGKSFLDIFPRGDHPFVKFDPAHLRQIVLGHRMAQEHRDIIRLWAATRIPSLDVVVEDPPASSDDLLEPLHATNVKLPRMVEDFPEEEVVVARNS